MKKKIATWLLGLSGWKVTLPVPKEAERCVMLSAPHTSNWDLWYGRLAFFVMEIPVRFAIKREWMQFPFGMLIRPLGGIAIDRRPKTEGGERPSQVEAMSALYGANDRLAIMVPPEGTRRANPKWKTGFYYVALAAKVPICLGYLDYANKRAGVGKVLVPSGNLEADLQIIGNFYRDIRGKHPERFALDPRCLGEPSAPPAPSLTQGLDQAKTAP